MNAFEMLAGQADFAGSNMAYNFDFIPEDKFDWKPAPEADSALGIANHVAQPLSGMLSMLENGEFKPDFTPATNRDEAKELVTRLSQAYAARLRSLSPQDAEGTVQMPFGGEWPRMRAISLPVIDLIHHHGQITYIQTLLGDTASHFEEMGT
ncbi:MAG TPA: DinB family protein [Abditibacteriaceae bacterium]